MSTLSRVERMEKNKKWQCDKNVERCGRLQGGDEEGDEIMGWRVPTAK